MSSRPSDGAGQSAGGVGPAGSEASTGRRTIGAVLAALTPQFPDLTISKIRFLEAEGLLTPHRTGSGYRTYTDDDIERLVAALTVPLNLEMAATEEMVAIALRHRPHAVCIVPERREEFSPGLDPELLALVQAVAEMEVREASNG